MNRLTKKERVLKAFDDLERAKVIDCKIYRQECNNCSNYYETVIIPQKIKDADKWWQYRMAVMWYKCRTQTCPYMTPDCDFFNNACIAWQQLKKQRGIE
jgi:hypothetical protein